MSSPSYLAAPYQVSAFDGAIADRHIVSRPDGHVWYLSAEALRLLHAVGSGGTLDEIAVRLERDLDRSVDVVRLRAVIDEQLVARGLVDVEGEPSRLSPRASPVTIRVRLLSALATRRLARSLSALMPDGAWFWAALLVSVPAAFVVAGRAARPAPHGAPTSIRLMAFAFMVLSTLAHELGHATACTKSGARCGEIGFGMYWYFPVLFTNLDDVWRLDRWHRARVDAAGLFFQSAFIVVAALIMSRIPGGGAALRGLPILLAIAVAYTLNPLLRFDGYWLLVDLTGVPNLRAASQHALRSIVSRRPHAPTADDTGRHALLLGRGARLALAAYATAAVIFATTLAVIGTRLFARWIATGAPAQIARAVAHAWLSLRNGDGALVLSNSVTTVELVLPAVIGAFLLAGCVRSVRAFTRQVIA